MLAHNVYNDWIQLTCCLIHIDNAAANTIELAADAHAKIVIFAGLPIKEPIVAQGPFVMNTQEEIQEAFLSYRNGTFLNGTSS